MNPTVVTNTDEEYVNLYKLTLPDGRFYIGKTRQTIQRRKSEHYREIYSSESSFDYQMKTYSKKETKVELLKKYPKSLIKEAEEEAIIKSKYNLNTGKANPLCLNLQINERRLNELAGLSLTPKPDEWYGVFRHYDIYKSMLKINGSNWVDSKAHADLIKCKYCGIYIRKKSQYIHFMCRPESEEAWLSLHSKYQKNPEFINNWDSDVQEILEACGAV